MNPFHYCDKLLFAEEVNLLELAKAYGTPCYVYSKSAIETNYQNFAEAFQQWPTQVCYAVKANSNLAILNLLANLGAGFDIVSIGELERVVRAEGDPSKIVFSGVAKRADEIHRALLTGIHCFNIESTSELARLDKISREMDIQTNVSLRVNPDVNPTTHPYISTGLKENKFGVDINLAVDIYKQIKTCSHLHAIGVDCHIGSQLLDLVPFKTCFERIFALIDELDVVGITLQHADLGGGLGIQYQNNDQSPSIAEYADILTPYMQGRNLQLIIEPGRAIVGGAGILLTRVEHIKETTEKNFVLVDAAMNDFIRPSLYSAWHEISNVEQDASEEMVVDVVGPVCETGDFFAKDRRLQVAEDNVLAIHAVGAYGFSMACNYNSRARAAEVLVDGDQAHLIRKRETIDQLFENEIIPD